MGWAFGPRIRGGPQNGGAAGRAGAGFVAVLERVVLWGRWELGLWLSVGGVVLVRGWLGDVEVGVGG